MLGGRARLPADNSQHFLDLTAHDLLMWSVFLADLRLVPKWPVTTQLLLPPSSNTWEDFGESNFVIERFAPQQPPGQRRYGVTSLGDLLRIGILCSPRLYLRLSLLLFVAIELIDFVDHYSCCLKSNVLTPSTPSKPGRCAKGREPRTGNRNREPVP